MVPWGTRIPIPGISNHFRDNFTSWKQSTLLGKGQLCRSALRQRSFCQKAWHEGTVTHGSRHTSSGPRSPLGGKVAAFFPRNPLLHALESEQGWPRRGGYSGIRLVQQTQKLLRKAEMSKWKVRAEPPTWRGSVALGGSGPPEIGRLFAVSREANARQASSLGCHPLWLPDGRHGFTFLHHTNSARVWCSASALAAAAGITAIAPRLRLSATERVLTHPLAGVPAEPPSRADWPSPASAPPQAGSRWPARAPPAGAKSWYDSGRGLAGARASGRASELASGLGGHFESW